MTYNEIINIAKRLDEETRERIDEEVAERLEILKLGDLNEEQMESMEECLYMSLVIQEYLDGEYELIDEERAFLLEEMAELYNEYNDLLLKAKLEEKVSKKKRLALELMRIREKLFKYKDRMHDVKEDMKTNRKNKSDLEDLSSKKKMKEVAKENKKSKWGFDGDTQTSKEENKKGRASGGGTNPREVAEIMKRDGVAVDMIANEVKNKLEANRKENLKSEQYDEIIARDGGRVANAVSDEFKNKIESRIDNIKNKDHVEYLKDSLASSYIKSGITEADMEAMVRAMRGK